MNIQKRSNKKILFILIFIFIILSAALFSLLNNRRNYSQLQHLQRFTERYELAYRSVVAQRRLLAKALASEIIDCFGIVDFYEELVSADDIQKNILRKKSTCPDYATL
ncbi:hypothetical protein HNV12_12365 [Methanococcoides sp. SA1]|nr:hypothetical protein [Methanococcoides sp. SA1]